MKKEELEILGRYNAQVSEGLCHKGTWILMMRELQKKYNKEMKELEFR